MTDTKPPPKFTDRDEWTASESFTFALSGRQPINPQWVKHRDDVLRDAGLLDDDEGEKA